jgi:hypothetical protein
LEFHSGREADHSPPSSAEVKEWVELYLHFPNTPSWRGAQLGEAQGQLYFLFRCYVGPCHHCMVCPQTAYRGDILIWRIDASISKKQSQTADKGWLCSLMVRREANKSSP